MAEQEHELQQLTKELTLKSPKRASRSSHGRGTGTPLRGSMSSPRARQSLHDSDDRQSPSGRHHGNDENEDGSRQAHKKQDHTSSADHGKESRRSVSPKGRSPSRKSSGSHFRRGKVKIPQQEAEPGPWGAEPEDRGDLSPLLSATSPIREIPGDASNDKSGHGLTVDVTSPPRRTHASLRDHSAGHASPRLKYHGRVALPSSLIVGESNTPGKAHAGSTPRPASARERNPRASPVTDPRTPRPSSARAPRQTRVAFTGGFNVSPARPQNHGVPHITLSR